MNSLGQPGKLEPIHPHLYKILLIAYNINKHGISLRFNIVSYPGLTMIHDIAKSWFLK